MGNTIKSQDNMKEENTILDVEDRTLEKFLKKALDSGLFSQFGFDHLHRRQVHIEIGMILSIGNEPLAGKHLKVIDGQIGMGDIFFGDALYLIVTHQQDTRSFWIVTEDNEATCVSTDD